MNINFLAFWIGATLMVTEITDSRLMSSLSWYHLTFLAISAAMMGLCGSGYLLATRPQLSQNIGHSLEKFLLLTSGILIFSRIGLLFIPISLALNATSIVAFISSLSLLTLPYFFFGIILSFLIASSETPHRTYFADLSGSAVGALVAVGLLNLIDPVAIYLIQSLGLVVISSRFKNNKSGSQYRVQYLFSGLIILPLLGQLLGYNLALRPTYLKQYLVSQSDRFIWNSHSLIIMPLAKYSPPLYWGRGDQAPNHNLETIFLNIDGEAGTVATRWDGDINSLAWTQHDVTSIPYHLRKSKDVAIIGIGGGRDILAALWANSSSITAIDINKTFLNLLNRDLKDFTKVVDHPSVRLVHEDGRRFLSSTSQHFDVVQMSLVDTWASTGVGAFALSENSLYTTEAFSSFLNRLTDNGVLSVSRWYSPEIVSETTRLVSLGSSALLKMGVINSKKHLVLLTKNSIATLLVFKSEITDRDLSTIETVSKDEGFKIELSPKHSSIDKRINLIAAARSLPDLKSAAHSPHFDFTPSSDRHPFFFNILKSTAIFSSAARNTSDGVIAGNLVATYSLVFVVIFSLVIALFVLGLCLHFPNTKKNHGDNHLKLLFASALVGIGYMALQGSFVQYWSIFLGHPTLTVGCVLSGMLLFNGIGSLTIGRYLKTHSARVIVLCTLGIIGSALFLQRFIQFSIVHLISASTLYRIGIVALSMIPLSLCLGGFMPLLLHSVDGDRFLGRQLVWLVNGIFGVFGGAIGLYLSVVGGFHLSIAFSLAMYILAGFLLATMQRGQQTHL